MHVIRLSAIFLGFLFSLATIHAVGPTTIPASDAMLLGSVLDESWDTTHAAESGYIDCMMPASDIDLNVTIATPGKVTLNFDPSVYDPKQAPTAGPRWIVEIDGASGNDVYTLGPGIGGIASPELPAGAHRVRFVQIGNTTGSGRWKAKDPQLSRVTGVTLPDGASLGKSARSSTWFIAITDSIGEGYMDMNATQSLEGAGAYTNNYRAWPSVAARVMNMSIAGYTISGIGVTHRGVGAPFGALNGQDPSGQNDPWDHIFEGVARPFTTEPAFILINVGLTEETTDVNVPGHVGNGDLSSVDLNFERNVLTFIARVRSHPILAKTPLLLSVPFGGYKRTPLIRALAEYRKSHPDDTYIYVFDIAYGSPVLTTTAGIDEVALFNGLTKNRPDDSDTTPTPQAPDRTHPYAIATPDIGSIDAHTLLGNVMAARITALINSGVNPGTGELTAGKLTGSIRHSTLTLTSLRATGGSAPYTYQFQTSPDGGGTWTNIGTPIDNIAATLKPIEITDHDFKRGVIYRVMVTDTAQPMATSYSRPTPR